MRNLFSLIVLLLLAPPLLGIEKGPEAWPPQPIAPWEKAAVELALAYASDGAEAWWEQLAESAPPGTREDPEPRRRALAAIEARVGPTEATIWELQTLVAGEPASPGPSGSHRAAFRLQYPSGADAFLILELEPSGDGWRLGALRSWAERDEVGIFPPAPRPSGIEASPPPAPPLNQGFPWSALVALGSGVILLLWGGRLWPGARSLAALAALAGLFTAGLGAATLLHGLVRPAARELPTPGKVPPSGAGSGMGSGVDEEGSGSLLALSRALARGADPARIDELAATLPGDGQAAALGRLWQAQLFLRGGDLNRAEGLLPDLLASPPLGQVLRGRLASLRGEEVLTALAYERALEGLPAADGLLAEAAEALHASGFEEQARGYLERLVAGGSRNASPFYLLARLAALDGDDAEAARLLRRAWSLEPRERGELLGERVYAHIVRRGVLFDLLELGHPREPLTLSPETGRDPLTLPPGWTASTLGRSLLLSRGETEIRLPGGSALAPPGTPAEDARTHHRRQEQRILATLPELRQAAAHPGSLAQPALRTRLTTAGEALARTHRWEEVLALTDGIAAAPEHLPGPLARLRAEALRRAGRPAEATGFLIQLARSNVAHRRKDPQALFHLADLLVEVGEYDLAVKVARRAEAQSAPPPLVSLLPRIRMEKRLATSFRIHRGPHFIVRYPATSSAATATVIADVLEAEAGRLRRWIPSPPGEPIEVHLFPFDEFFSLYSQGGEALGIFDGKVRVPLAEVSSLSPFVVAILTHEVAHALIASATSDQAPAWFHEGLAQHVQMLQNRINPMADYQAAGRLLAFPLLEPVLGGHSDPELTALAYDESLWVVHYLESRHGVEGIHRLLAAYARGLPTDEALAEAFGITPSELDAAFRAWSLESAPEVWPTDLIRYDLGERP